ncbi:TPA: hypothetical protein MCL62_002233 [Klebsiella pneumoniae]|nr:hypothetical protein [Klebsiella pneumoniae]
MTGLFDTSDTGGNVSGGVSPQQAVAPAPSAITSAVGSGALNSVGNLFTAVVQGYAEGAKKAQAAKDAGVISNYGQKLTALDAAVAQGSMSHAEAQRRQRALYNSAIANNPHLTEKLTGFTKDVTTTEGLGDTLAKGTAVDQQIVTDTKQATAEGFITEGMTPEQQENGLNLYKQRQQQIGEMKFYSQQLDIQKQKMSIQAQAESIAASRVQRANAAADLQIKKNQMYARQATADFSANVMQHTQTQLDKIQADLSAGKITNEQAMVQANSLKDAIMAQTQKIRGAAGGSYVDDISSPIFKSIDNRMEFLSGKITEDTLKSRNNSLQAQAELPYLSDPKMASVIASSKYLGGITNPQILGEAGGYMAEFLRKNMNPNATPANPVSTDPDEKAGTKAYTGGLVDNINNLKNKNPAIADPKGTFEELQVHVNQLMKGGAAFSGTTDDPKGYNNLVNFLANPAFLDYQKMGGHIDADNLRNMRNAIASNYSDKLVPAIQNAWEQGKSVVGVPQTGTQIGAAFVPTPNTKPAGDTIRYVWTGKTIEFKPAKGFENNAGVRAKAGELQRQLAPLINKNVMMRAHLDGSSDYSKYFKMSEPEMFGTKAQDTSSVNGR